MPNQIKSQLATLVMKSFGLSLNTLEQVFITIGDKVDKVMASRQNSMASHNRQNSEPASSLKVNYSDECRDDDFFSLRDMTPNPVPRVLKAIRDSWTARREALSEAG